MEKFPTRKLSHHEFSGNSGQFGKVNRYLLLGLFPTNVPAAGNIFRKISKNIPQRIDMRVLMLFKFFPFPNYSKSLPIQEKLYELYLPPFLFLFLYSRGNRNACDWPPLSVA